MITLKTLDHLVLTVADIPRSSAFYRDILGCEVITFAEGRTALAFGSMKINLHQRGKEYEPKARVATPGSADLCLLVEPALEIVMAFLEARGITIEEGPLRRSGARFPLVSIYIRDPDGNLLELSTPAPL